MDTSRPSVIDLFAGAGGLSLGFHAAGCHIQAAIDIDEAAGISFLENFQRLQPDAAPEVLYGDEGSLEDLDLDRVARGGRPDILIGGPPCQGFSRLGRAKLNDLSEEGFEGDPRNALYRTFLEAARQWKPGAVVMENVSGMLSVGDQNVADEAAAELASYGYRVGYAVLNAVWYGVPQFRERLFLLGIRENIGTALEMPAATHRALIPSGYLRPSERRGWTPPLPFITHYELPVDLESARRVATTVCEALDDLPVLTEHLGSEYRPQRGDFRRPLAYRCHPRSDYAHLMRSWPGLPRADFVTDHAIRRTPRDYEIFRRMKPGDRYPEALAIAWDLLRAATRDADGRERLPAEGSPEYSELVRKFIPPYPEAIFRDKWRKLIPDQPSWTVPAHLSKDAYSHIHHDSAQARAISIREAARLQSFPDAFFFAGNMGDCYRQIGNAVPPLLAWAVASTVLKLLGKPGSPPSFD